jgi:enoyl-CoA hydratase
MIIGDDRGSIRVLRLNHGKVSTIDLELCEAIIAALDAARDGSVRALVITGTGSSFSAGVDLYRVINDGPAYGARFLPALDAMLRAALTFPKPLVAAVNGHAIAGGCVLAAACDYRVMAEGTGRIGVPELVVGVPFPALPLEIMAARVPASALRDLVYTGRNVQVDEAIAKGLVDEKAPPDQVIDRACAVAEQFASISANAFALTKETFYRSMLARVDQLADVNARAVEAWKQQATYDTIRAYLERTVGKKPG